MASTEELRCRLRTPSSISGRTPPVDKNMLAQNNVVGVASRSTQLHAHLRHPEFYAITGGSPNVSCFHTTGDVARARIRRL